MNASCKPFAIGIALLLTALVAASPSLAADPPKTVSIDPLVEYYAAAPFDHEMHLDVADSCATCHHHTAGVPPKTGVCAKCHRKADAQEKVACRACHAAQPFVTAEIGIHKDGKTYHIDIPGLKGAYHLNCLGCHQQMGGPTGCQDCHKRVKKGDDLFSAGAAKAPKAEEEN